MNRPGSFLFPIFLLLLRFPLVSFFSVPPGAGDAEIVSPPAEPSQSTVIGTGTSPWLPSSGQLLPNRKQQVYSGCVAFFSKP